MRHGVTLRHGATNARVSGREVCDFHQPVVVDPELADDHLIATAGRCSTGRLRCNTLTRTELNTLQPGTTRWNIVQCNIATWYSARASDSAVRAKYYCKAHLHVAAAFDAAVQLRHRSPFFFLFFIRPFARVFVSGLRRELA